MRVAHLTFDLGARHQGGHRVDHEHVERAGADEHVGDLERLLTGVGLTDQQIVDVDADRRRVHRVHGVLGVDVRAHPTVALRLGHHVHGQRGFPRRLRTEDLDHSPPRQTADTERDVERERAGGHGGDADIAVLPQPHDRALAELLLDLADRHLEGFVVAFHDGTLRLFSCIALWMRFGPGKCREGNLRQGYDSYL